MNRNEIAKTVHKHYLAAKKIIEEFDGDHMDPQAERKIFLKKKLLL